MQLRVVSLESQRQRPDMSRQQLLLFFRPFFDKWMAPAPFSFFPNSALLNEDFSILPRMGVTSQYHQTLTLPTLLRCPRKYEGSNCELKNTKKSIVVKECRLQSSQVAFFGGSPRAEELSESICIAMNWCQGERFVLAG